MDFKKLLAHSSVTGETSNFQSIIKEELDRIGVEYQEDGYGSIITGNAAKNDIMVVAHVDEVGFQISKVNDDGTLSILPVGWVFPNRLDHTPVYISTSKGLVYGAIFHKISLKSESVGLFSELFLDVGATSAEEVDKMGVKIGQVGSFKKEYWENGDTIFATGVDNKVSVQVILELLKENKEIGKKVSFAFHTDEEMQDHSANSLAYQFNPEYVVIMDYCPIHQQQDPEDNIPADKGPVIIYRGGAHILHEGLRSKFDELSIAKAFISDKTLPSLEPQNFQNNGKTKAVNYCIPARGYHGQIYAIRKSYIKAFKQGLLEIVDKLNS